jgi:hypothetical protein
MDSTVMPYTIVVREYNNDGKTIYSLIYNCSKESKKCISEYSTKSNK